MKPADLAAEHGLSTQAIRNYERDGFIPPAPRTASGYRVYTSVHAAALRAYLALVAAHGRPVAAAVMTSLHQDAVDDALAAIDRAHAQTLRDRETLAAVREAVHHLTTAPVPSATTHSIGELAHQLRVTPATLRDWETAGILAPTRDPAGARLYGPLDVRDAHLTHLLRRGGYPLPHIATVIHHIRDVGTVESLTTALAEWQHTLTTRGLAALTAASALSSYLTSTPRPGR
ncbi:MerR family DNA-binding transcriptional regulator [Actinokineospora terrae]|uniref:DNA-binding transcriptional regulator, MerR family n=1 Tax=Actinokineospora terrae TaxID=155974 RepID=A0A1H9XHM1_9PSEU|nr:MerR family DNA-binding transcriptional regulator [Actinokineospora terrae]SES45559.1 DNA-binding transcriptional regulator, MerR family [Actinokineospora terrae]